MNPKPKILFRNEEKEKNEEGKNEIEGKNAEKLTGSEERDEEKRE